MHKLAISSLLISLAAALAAPPAHAFCGFYVAGGDQQMFNEATQVVLMRMGTRTVLSMQNNYQGPPEAFAIVIPVPVVLQKGDVKTLGKAVFEHVEKMGAPRLVEYWEQDPCAPDQPIPDFATARPRSASAGKGGAQTASDFGVTIEAKFEVGEYQVLILSAKDSTGLDGWLRQEKYTIPAAAEPLLRPYVESGMKFFVAKVDPAKVQWVEATPGASPGSGTARRAELSPLRFHYDAEEFALPIRLGLANSSGTQDLIVNILSPNQRFEVANYKNVTIPTNIDVDASMKDRFGAFYTALFDRTIEKHPGAVVTEYAWQATTCDPCPGPALGYHEFQLLGADVLEGARAQPTPYQRADFVLTRLHARYGKELTDDLRFKAATPIVGGREHVLANGQLEEGAQGSNTNNFQGRYAIRHAWTGPITCKDPQRGRWGGPPGSGGGRQNLAPGSVQPATDLAFAPRGEVELGKVVKRDIPEIDVRIAGASNPIGAGSATPAVPTPPATTPPATPAAKAKSGCGCGTGSADLGWLAGVLGVAALWRRRRAPRRGR